MLHVDAAELGLREIDQGLGVLAAGHVDGAKARGAALRRYVSHQLLEALGAARTHHHVGATLRQQAGDGLANAARSAGDDNDFPLDARHGGSSRNPARENRAGCEGTVRFRPSKAVDQNSFLIV